MSYRRSMRNIQKLKEKEEMKKVRKEEPSKEIKSIEEALEEKRVREIQNLEIKLEQDRLCAEMRNMEQIADILNSVDDARRTGCTMKEEQQCHNVSCETNTHVEHKEVHGDDCHCSKCCPNPKPNFFQRNRNALLIGMLWLVMVVLAIGWSPSGGIAEAINTSWVEMFVDFFKVTLFAVAGIVTYRLTKKKDD